MPIDVVVDVGTGSGAIIVAISDMFPTSRLIAIDISDEALEIAKTNADFHAVPV